MKFILSSELGRLARWLRLLNYDSCYFKGSSKALILKALKEDRFVLTSRSDLVNESKVKFFIVKSQDLKNQLRNLKEELGLKIGSDNKFSRCINCNLELKELTMKQVEGNVPMAVYQNEKNFYGCSKCKKIFWLGSHQKLVNEYLDSINNDS